MKQCCTDCGDPIGKRSTYYCDYCRGWRAGYQDVAMRHKRAKDPAMREAERAAVKARMRKLRAQRSGTLRPSPNQQSFTDVETAVT